MTFKGKLLSGLAIAATIVLAAQAQVPGVNSTLNTVFTLVYDSSTMKPTYSAVALFTPPAAGATSTDVCSLTGSATKTVKLRRVFFSGIATTAVTDPVALIKRSTASTNANGAALAAIPYDSTNSLTNSTSNAATAVVELYATVPVTLGTLVGVIADPLLSFGNLTTGGAQTITQFFTFGERGSPIVLRGVAQSVNINLNGSIYAGGVFYCGFEWTEE